METDAKLIEKRQELKDEITAGINKTPMARFFNVTSSVVQKITRYPKPLPVLYCTALWIPLILIPVLFYMILFHQSRISAEISLFSAIVILEAVLLVVVGTYFNINRALREIRDELIDSIVSLANLSDLHKWLTLGWSPALIKRFVYWWYIALISPLLLVLGLTLDWGHNAKGIGLLLIFFIIYGFLGWIVSYYVPLMILLSFKELISADMS